ncbi:FAD-dependent oxidoreductase [uncultured Tateyamaria sp.]|uniref:NAD(P)/FAD-dependent oxidoreductase n=1 Tax=uncultured Tateyamaria sp. TaxID=455651 RepID=UPI00260FC975|nr:FAD-dependent oxidoreductase [uncultured Tateyamaria sp.]
MKVVIIGGGIIGAALAHRLIRDGADVTVLDAGLGATAASFGWINASFFLDDDHFRLRAEGIAAWRRLGVEIAWSGCLCWEESGDAFDAQAAALRALGYPVKEVDADWIRRAEPHLRAPDRALRFAQEGVAAPSAVACDMLCGAKVVRGLAVTHITETSGRITGVATRAGHIAADRVIVAAGTASTGLLAPLGVHLPMLERPGAMMRTRALPSMLAHVMAAPGQELRQDAQGHVWAPMAAQHQGDARTSIDTPPDVLAQETLARLRALLPGAALEWEEVLFAHRPVPQDGRPVIGPCGPSGLFAAVMHSGVTLAAITAETLVPQVMNGALSNTQAALVAPYGADRFQSG